MKRLFLALLILASGTTVFCAFRHSAADLRHATTAQYQEWQVQTQLVAQTRIERERWLERIRETQSQLAALPAPAQPLQLASLVLTNDGWRHLSAEQTEQLLADLGFNWSTPGNYLIVSKKSLAGISLTGIRGAKLTEAARAVLAVTPAEQAAIEQLTEQLRTEHSDWVTAHVKRETPRTDELARYTMPRDAWFSQTRSNVFTSGILATLGPERGGLMREHYAYSWMQDTGMFDGLAGMKSDADGSTTLTVKSYPSGAGSQLLFTLKQAGSSMTAGVSPWQTFPAAFRPLFPNGWEDLAAREGFELPADFKKHQAR